MYRICRSSLGRSCLLVVGVALSDVGIAIAVDDTWPRYGHDAALTGRTLLTGDITAPRVAWSISLAGHQLEIELRPESGRDAVRLPGEQSASVAPRTVDVPGAMMRDLDGSGTLRPAVESYHQRWAKILPDVKGLQRIAWDQTWTTSKICHLELFAYDQGHDKPRRVWQSEAEGTVFMPLCVVYDIDGDGVQEICVALHYRVMIYEGTTGRKETELKYHSSRGYGWFGLADVDADGQMELVTLADFQSHLDVLEYDPTKPEKDRLSVKWRREIEQAIQDRSKWPQIGPRPLADVTGDGRPEIVINLFSDTGDDEWHTVVIEAATGKVLVDLPKRYTHGNADIDGDGAAEIFCTATDGVFVPTYGRIEVIDAPGGEASVLWSREFAGFGLANLPRPGPTWSTGASMGMRHVLLTDEPSRPAFLVLSRDEKVMKGAAASTADRRATLTALRHEASGGLKSLWQVDGLVGDIETVAMASKDGGVSALSRVRLPAKTDAKLEANDAAVAVVAPGALGTLPHTPIAARLRPDGPVHVIAQGAGENVFLLQAPRDSAASPSIVWQRTGRGIGNGSRPGTAVAVDLDGDRVTEIIVADQTASGAAMLTACRADGKPHWQRTFPRTPGAVPVHNVGALVYWWPGHFRSTDTVDLFVNTRRGLMHSDVGHLLDGRSGRIVWTHEKAIAPDQFNWGYAGVPPAVADMLGDGRDEIVNLYPVCFWIADGADGKIIAAQELAGRKVLPAWAAYGQPIVHDFTGDGNKDVLLDSVYILALLDRTGKPVWHGKRRVDYATGKADDNIGETTNIRHALVDFDGDGRCEIASGGYKDGVRAIDPRDGKVLWSLEAPKPTGAKCAAANIDGTGGDELLYVAGNELIAITGDRKMGRVLWTWKAPTTLSMPAIADLDGDGKAEIVLQSADGTIHCIDGPAS